MTRNFIIAFLSIISLSEANSQLQHVNSSKELALKLTKGLTSDKQKVDALFYWVIDNIEYDFETLNNSEPYPDFYLEPTTDTIEFENNYDEAVANLVLLRKKGICDGYARLFKSLCGHVKIECQLIIGKVKLNPSNKLGEHAWNAVKIENQWYLLDPTWASGHDNGSGSFQKERDLFYFLTSPREMFINHYPDDQQWTLLDKTYNFEYFKNHPIEDIRLVKNGLVDFYPKNKTITLRRGELITIWLEFDKSPKTFDINISDYDQRSKASKLQIIWSDNTYDSLIRIDPEIFTEVKNIEIVSEKVIENRIEFVIKPLIDIRGIIIHVDHGFPALDYNILYKK